MKLHDRLILLAIASLLVWNAYFTVRQTKLAVGYTTALQAIQEQQQELGAAAQYIQALQQQLDAANSKIQELGSPPPTI